jgi:hypothetical protein
VIVTSGTVADPGSGARVNLGKVELEADSGDKAGLLVETVGDSAGGKVEANSGAEAGLLVEAVYKGSREKVEINSDVETGLLVEAVDKGSEEKEEVNSVVEESLGGAADRGSGEGVDSDEVELPTRSGCSGEGGYEK